MSVIVDTSVWSLVLRRGSEVDDPQASKLRTLLRQGQPVLLLGVILQELLQGIRSSSDADKLRTRLEPFEMLTLCRDDYVAAAELSNLCRSKGIQASTIDFIIAAACIRHDCTLLTSDVDFQHIARVCPLQLL